MPENGFFTHHNHGFWLEFSLFPQSCSLSAAEDDHFHTCILAIEKAVCHFFYTSLCLRRESVAGARARVDPPLKPAYTLCMHVRQLLWVAGCSAVGLGLLVALAVYHYEWNVSTLLRMDVRFGQEYRVPEGVILYEEKGYDGMAYYEIAREIPTLLLGQDTHFGSAYRFQRILFPLFGYLLALGNDAWFPVSFLIINILASIGSLVLLLLTVKRMSVHSFTILCNPAILVGILFSLTEPLSLFFIMLFFFLWERQGRTMGFLASLSLLLSLLSRETTVFLIVLLLVWALAHKRWRDTIWLLFPVGLFLLWQYFLALHFDSIAFQAGERIMNLSLRGPRQLIVWLFEKVNSYRLSSLPLLIFLVLLSARLMLDWWRVRISRSVDITSFLLTGLVGTMLSMDPHMWGVITSIGRVVTPLYPVYALYACYHDTRFMRGLSLLLIVTSVVSAIGIALVHHPYILS